MNLIRPVKILIVLTLLVVSLELSILFHPPLYVFALAVTGRSPLCRAFQALEGAQRYQSFRQNDRITRGSRLLEHDPAGFNLWETPRGRYWIPAGNDDVLLILLTQQDMKIYGIDEQTVVHSGDIVLDCGAHVGVYTREALASGAKLVVAIEPARENLACLQRNFASEIAAGSVIVYPKGVWDKDDFLTLFTYPRNSAADDFVIPDQEVSPPDSTKSSTNYNRQASRRIKVEAGRFHQKKVLCCERSQARKAHSVDSNLV